MSNRKLKYHFETFEEFLDYANYEDARTKSELVGYGDHDFHGATLPEALKLARGGWPEGLARVREMSDKLMGQFPKSQIHEWSHDLAGDIVDVGRYLMNDPECFIAFDGPMGTLGIVSIACNISVSAAVSKETMFYRGAQIVSIVDLLETKGYRCEVQAILAGSSSDYRDSADPTTQISIMLKRPDMPLDMSRLAYALCHDSFFRRLGFHTWYRNGFRDIGGMSLGYPIMKTSHEQSCDIYLPGVHSGHVSAESAAKWTREQLEKVINGKTPS